MSSLFFFSPTPIKPEVYNLIANLSHNTHWCLLGKLFLLQDDFPIGLNIEQLCHTNIKNAQYHYTHTLDY